MLNNVIVLDFSRIIYDDLHGLSHIYIAQTGKTFDDRWELYNVTKYNISQDGIFIKIKKQNLLAGSPGKGGEYNSGESILSRELDDLDDFDF